MLSLPSVTESKSHFEALAYAVSSLRMTLHLAALKYILLDWAQHTKGIQMACVNALSSSLFKKVLLFVLRGYNVCETKRPDRLIKKEICSVIATVSSPPCALFMGNKGEQAT